MVLSLADWQAAVANRKTTAIIREPLVVPPNTSLIDAIAHMHDWRGVSTDNASELAHLNSPGPLTRASCVLVGEAGQVVGILTQWDIVRIIAERQSLLRQSASDQALLVGQVMTQPVITLREADFTDVFATIHFLKCHGIHHLPLLDEHDTLVGLITQDSLQQVANPVEVWPAFELGGRPAPGFTAQPVTPGTAQPPRQSDSTAIPSKALQQELQARQRIESLLLESEQRYASLAAAAPVGIYRTDQTGNLIYVNDRFCQIAGLSPDQAMGSGWQQALHPEDHDQVLATWQTGLPGKKAYSLEYRFQPAENQVVWVYGQMVAELDVEGHRVGYLGTITDISDRKQLEIAARQSQQQLKDVLDSAVTGIIRLRFYPDTSIQYDYISPYCEENFGYTAAELMPDANLWRSRIHPEDWQTVVLPAMQAILNHQSSSVQVMEYRFNRKDNSIGWILAKCFAQWNQAGQYWHITVVDSDISLRKQAELALQHSEQTNRAIIETIPDLLIQMNQAGDYRFMSGKKDMLRTRYPQVGTCEPDVYAALPPELAQRQLFYARRAWQTGYLQVYEHILTDDEEQRYEEVRIAPLNADEVLIIIRDITERKQAERQLQNLIEATAMTTGEEFFPALVIHITEALQVSHALVAEKIGNRVRTLAAWSDGGLQPPYSGSFGQAPCEQVLRDGVFYCERGVQEQFPDDSDLAEMKVESCLGVALHDMHGNIIGHLCIFDKRPIQQPRQAEDLLRVFAARAAAELERQRASLSLERLNQRLEIKVEERTARLQEREKFLRTLLDTFPLSIFWKDRSSVYQGCNANFLKDSGLTSQANIIGKTDYDLPWAITEADAFRRDDQRVMASGKAQLGIIETQIQANGQQVWLETNKLPLHNLAGEVVGVLGTYQDITERKRSEQALQESEQRFRRAIANAPFPIMIHAEDGEVLQLNDAWTEFTGYALADIPTTHDWAERAYGPEAAHTMEATIAQKYTMASRWDEGEFTITIKDGTLRIWNFSSAPLGILSDGRRAVISMAADVTQRRQAESQVQSLLHRTQLLNLISTEIRDSLDLEIILQNSVNAIVASLSADICTFAWHQESGGASCWKIVKEQKKTALGSWLGTYQDNEFPKLFDDILQNNLYRVDDVEYLEDAPLRTFLMASGIQLFLCLPIHPIGGRIGSLQIGRCSLRKPWQTEEIELLKNIANQVAIAIFQAQLYEESQAKTVELEHSYRELQETQFQLIQSEKMSSLGQLVAGIAHEINNPVSFIYGNLSMASDYAQALSSLIKIYRETFPHPPEIISQAMDRLDIEYALNDFPKLLASMETGATRIRDIVKSLRIFSRLDRADCKAVNIHENIDGTLVILQNRLNGRAGKPEIRVVKQYGDLPLIECYGSLLNQVFMNLLVNAIDAIEERQATATADYSGCITITTTVARAERITITFQDNGIGMAPDTQAKIFDPFFTTKPVGLGTGMGLPTSYQIMTSSHQGQLYCTSTLGCGTLFTLELRQSIAASSSPQVTDH